MIFDRLIEARPYIEAALERADEAHEFDDVAAGVLSGRFQLWNLPNGAMVTEIQQFSRKRVLNVFLGGGDLGEIVAMHDDFEEFGKANGCSCMTVTGRHGWARALPQHGWKKLYVTMKKDFD